MKPDYIIIGAGIIGCATALALAREGAQVTILDRGALGAESSWAGGGILLPLLPWDYSDAVVSLAPSLGTNVTATEPTRHLLLVSHILQPTDLHCFTKTSY